MAYYSTCSYGSLTRVIQPQIKFDFLNLSCLLSVDLSWVIMSPSNAVLSYQFGRLVDRAVKWSYRCSRSSVVFGSQHPYLTSSKRWKSTHSRMWSNTCELSHLPCSWIRFFKSLDVWPIYVSRHTHVNKYTVLGVRRSGFCGLSLGKIIFSNVTVLKQTWSL